MTTEEDRQMDRWTDGRLVHPIDRERWMRGLAPGGSDVPPEDEGDSLDIKTTIGDTQALLSLVRELPLHHVVALERHPFESNHGPLERPSNARESEAVVSAILALEEAVRLFHARRRAEDDSVQRLFMVDDE
jgi:hypothetical protein